MRRGSIRRSTAAAPTGAAAVRVVRLQVSFDDQKLPLRPPWEVPEEPVCEELLLSRSFAFGVDVTVR